MAATDDFPGDPGITAPYTHAADVTPHDTNELTKVTRAILATVAGTCTLVTSGGDTIQITMLAGVVYPIRAKIIKSTGTAATGIKALW